MNFRVRDNSVRKVGQVRWWPHETSMSDSCIMYIFDSRNFEDWSALNLQKDSKSLYYFVFGFLGVYLFCCSVGLVEVGTGRKRKWNGTREEKKLIK